MVIVVVIAIPAVTAALLGGAARDPAVGGAPAGGRAGP